ncbi:MAG: ATPase, partial [Streptococcus thermophilus]|nr:ATPase [Streptococcus thermophilus]
MKFVKKQLQGLTQMEVKQRIDDGKTNYFKAKAGSSNWDIFRRNVFNSFNMLNFAIFVALIAVQAWSNLFFFGIIVLNAFTGMMTELRARRMVDKLNLMNQDQIRVVRDGQLVSIDPKDIVLDDIMLLSAGEQVPSDAVVVDGMAELNEAMLTGESDQILKKDGKELL